MKTLFPCTVREFLSQFGNWERVEDTSGWGAMDRPVLGAWFSIGEDSRTFVHADGIVLISFQMDNKGIGTLGVCLCLNDNDGTAWDRKLRDGTLEPHTSRPSPKLKLVVTA